MPVTIRIKGRILPEYIGLSMVNVPKIDFIEPPYPPDLPNTLKVQYEVRVNNGAIEMECSLDSYTETLAPWIINRGLRFAKALIDIYGFSAGIPSTVILDSFIDPNGNEKEIRFSNPHLMGACFSLQLSEYELGSSLEARSVLELVIGNNDIALALRDLISAITNFDTAVVDCARAIDGLRHIMWPHEDRARGWPLLREAVNASEDYLDFIMDASKKLRHGNREYISKSTLDEVTKRSWIIMGRFLEYRLRGSQPLSNPEFPLL